MVITQAILMSNTLYSLMNEKTRHLNDVGSMFARTQSELKRHFLIPLKKNQWKNKHGLFVASCYHLSSFFPIGFFNKKNLMRKNHGYHSFIS